MAHITEAEQFAKAHGEPFNCAGWLKVVQVYQGMLPVNIYAVPEGTPVRGGNAIVAIEWADSELFWLPSYLETAIQRAVWYPTTIASLDYEIKQDIRHFYRISGADPSGVDFSLHDFGARGVTCSEQAEVGGLAHTFNFKGSDTIEGVRAANYYYNEPMAAFSVPATEHSVECSYGGSDEQEERYLGAVLDAWAKPGAILSIVIDGYDVYRAAESLCTTFREKIINSGAKVVFRPDSGDMMEVVPRILDMQAKAFGVTKNRAGYNKINHVGVLQGDGVDHMSIRSLLGKVLAKNYSADCLVFGSGGALLQKVNRDTYRFAQKTSAVLVDGKWVGTAKAPKTDMSKSSLSGRIMLFRSKTNNELVNGDMGIMSLNEYEHVMKPVWSCGLLLNETSLAEIRARCAI